MPVAEAPPRHPESVAPPGTAARRHTADGALIEALLTGVTYAVAAERAGVSLRTVKRRMADPGFQRRFQEAQEESIKRVRRRATAGAERGLDVLVAIAVNANGEAEAEGAAARSIAARAILQAFVQLQPKHLTADVESRSTVRYEIPGIDLEAMR